MEMLTVPNLVLAAGTLITGLIAGLFFGFSVAVIPGLTKLSDPGYLQSFQHINAAILNPVFLFCFIAPLALLPVASWLQFRQGGSSAWIWTLAATVLYVIMVFGVTIAGNVPLNDTLVKMELTNASAQTLSAYRSQFQPRWNSFHSIRTIANIISLACLIMACILTIKK